MSTFTFISQITNILTVSLHFTSETVDVFHLFISGHKCVQTQSQTVRTSAACLSLVRMRKMADTESVWGECIYLFLLEHEYVLAARQHKYHGVCAVCC